MGAQAIESFGPWNAPHRGPVKILYYPLTPLFHELSLILAPNLENSSHFPLEGNILAQPASEIQFRMLSFEDKSMYVRLSVPANDDLRVADNHYR